MRYSVIAQEFLQFIRILFCCSLLLNASTLLAQDAKQNNTTTTQQERCTAYNKWPKGGTFEGYTPAQEIREKRDRTSKHFLRSDGMTDAVITSSASIHYLAGDGSWQEINTFISTSADRQYQYENITNTVKSYFPAQHLSANGIRIGAHDI